jgi:hypothetical protein
MKYFLALILLNLFNIKNSLACSSYGCVQIDICMSYNITFSDNGCEGKHSAPHLDPDNDTTDNSRLWVKEYTEALTSKKLPEDWSYQDSSNNLPSDLDSEFEDFINDENSWPFFFKEAIQIFRDRKFEEAYPLFKDRANKAAPGPEKEYAQYLAARTALILSQKNWDSYPPFDSIDKSWLLKAEEEFSTYLKNYPKGVFVKSATGLLRRTHYFLNNESKTFELLYKSFELQLSKTNLSSPEEAKALYHLLLENYSLLERTKTVDLEQTHPFFWPVLANYIAREIQNSDGAKEENLKWTNVNLVKAHNFLMNQKQKFEKYPQAYRLSLGTISFRLGKFKEGISIYNSLSPDENKKLITSEVALKGRLLIGLKKYSEARMAFQTQTDLSRLFNLSYYYEDKVEDSFLNNTTYTPRIEDAIYTLKDKALVKLILNPKLDPKFRDPIVEMSISRLMWTQSWDKLVLIKKYFPDKYKKFGDHLELYLKNKNIESFAYIINNFPPGANAVSNTCKAEETKELKSPIAYYIELLKDTKKFSPDKKLDYEAEALNKAIKCFKQSHASEECFTSYNERDQPLSLRKEWFNRLNKKYSNTKWILKHYW